MIPKFSIIIATYNRGSLLGRALESLANQTEKSWEAIIVDDGSTDNTLEVVQPFIRDFKNIRYIRQENQGEPAAKNRGVALSQSEYITFLDSDDTFSPDHLDSRRHILEKSPNIQLLHGGIKIIGDEFVPDKNRPGEMIHLSECVIGATFFISKKDFFMLGGLQKLPIGNDAALFEKAVLSSLKIIKTDMPTYWYYRTNTDSITHQYLNKNQ